MVDFSSPVYSNEALRTIGESYPVVWVLAALVLPLLLAPGTKRIVESFQISPTLTMTPIPLAPDDLRDALAYSEGASALYRRGLTHTTPQTSAVPQLSHL